MPRSTLRWRWSTPGLKLTARRRRPNVAWRTASGQSGDLDVLPETESVFDVLHFRAGRLIRPGGPGMPLAGNNDVVKLHAVGALKVVSGFFCLFQPVHPHRCRRKVLISLAINDF